MARRTDNGAAIDPALSQKKRARRRLIGAAAIALMAAIVLPLVLDSEPRQQYADVEVEIPSRDTPLRPPTAPAQAEAEADAASAASPAAAAGDAGITPDSPADPAGTVGASASSETPAALPVTPKPSPSHSTASKPDVPKPDPAAKPSAEPKPGAKPAPKPAATPKPVPEPKPAADPPQKTASTADDTREAARSGNFVLQIGAYAKSESAKAMNERARKAGVRAYTETVQTQDGARTRVRVGPFADRDAAERARGKLKLVGIDSKLVPLAQ